MTRVTHVDAGLEGEVQVVGQIIQNDLLDLEVGSDEVQAGDLVAHDVGRTVHHGRGGDGLDALAQELQVLGGGLDPRAGLLHARTQGSQPRLAVRNREVRELLPALLCGEARGRGLDLLRFEGIVALVNAMFLHFEQQEAVVLLGLLGRLGGAKLLGLGLGQLLLESRDLLTARRELALRDRQALEGHALGRGRGLQLGCEQLRLGALDFQDPEVALIGLPRGVEVIQHHPDRRSQERDARHQKPEVQGRRVIVGIAAISHAGSMKGGRYGATRC